MSRDGRSQAAERLRALIEDGVASGQGRELTEHVIDELWRWAIEGGEPAAE